MNNQITVQGVTVELRKNKESGYDANVDGEWYDLANIRNMMDMQADSARNAEQRAVEVAKGGDLDGALKARESGKAARKFVVKLAKVGFALTQFEFGNTRKPKA